MGHIKSKRFMAIFVGLALALTLAPSISMADEATDGIETSIDARSISSSAISLTVTRIGGADRYATSAAIATYDRDHADTAIIVSGEDRHWPDAISASGLAGLYDAPIIATSPDSLSPYTERTILDLGVSKAIILGSTATISATTENQIRAAIGSNGTVERIAGSTRQDTAELAYKSLPSNQWVNPDGKTWTYTGPWKNPGGKKAAILVTGNDFPDGLSVTYLANRLHYPIFLLDQDGSMTTETKRLLAIGRFDEVYVIGSESSVPDSTAREAASLVNPTQIPTYGLIGTYYTRIYGFDRYETSVNSILFCTNREMTPLESLVITRGDAHADAVSGAALGSPMLLTPVPVNAEHYNSLFMGSFLAMEGGDEMIFLGSEASIPRSTVDAYVSKWWDWHYNYGTLDRLSPLSNEPLDELTNEYWETVLF